MLSITGVLLLLTLITANLSLGVLVISRNPRAVLNRLFLLMTLGITAWAASSIISDSTGNLMLARYASYAAFGASFFGLSAAYIFALTNRSRRLRPGYVIYLLALVLPASVLFATPLVYRLETIDTYQNGPLYAVYLLAMGITLLLTVKNFWHTYRKGSAIERNQVAFIMFGFFTMAFLALITNAIIPAIVDITWVTKLGPIFSAVFIAFVAYAIVKHRLFDIRLAIARSIAYVFATLVVALLYVGIVGIASRLFLKENGISINYQLISIAIALFVGFTFQPIKHYFDRVTNRLFFRDIYDPQVFLDKLGDVLVLNNRLDNLVKYSVSVIEETIQTNGCYILLRDRHDGVLHMEGDRNADSDVEIDLSIIEKLKLPLLTDELGDKDINLVDKMHQYDISVVLDMSTKTGKVGYLILGPKKTGSIYSRRDVQVLKIVADELAIALQNALRFEEIEKFNITLQKKINEATQELRWTNKKLKELDEAKDEFISMASHQLRTPLTTVKGYVSMVLEGDAGKISGQQRELLNQAFASSQRMVYLIADLLNVSRMHTGKFVIDKKPTYLPDVVAEELKQLEETAKARQLEIVYSKPKTFPTIDLDEDKIRQVIMNFTDNAIYYTPSGGRIEVSLTASDKTIKLTVSDNGIGIPKHDQHNLFTKFFRAENARKARPDGTGLGLFMAKKVIDASGGEIIFSSQEGKGSTFGFTFPIKPSK